ncbi:MAG: flagellar brake protein [Zoogloeaceae bacterium]|jgi:c-di-GMP-binding flagellar brake protein YcgR|nr:flagellar brake protein [Zoogloeaceae bacterium]
MPNTATLKMQLEDVDIYSQYLLRSPAEIAYVLREIMQKGCMVTVYFDNGHSFFLTSILEVSPQGLILDYSNDETVNQRALQSDRLICLTSVNRIKIQFALSGCSRTQYENRTAFSCLFPETLLRLQRREFFRVNTPVANPIKCDIPIRRAGASGTILQIPLIDISVGGMGLMATTEQADFLESGIIVEDCLLAIPEEAQITMALKVRDAFEISTRSGSKYIRVGCEYHNLKPNSLNIIQRYITRLERERKARISGME